MAATFNLVLVRAAFGGRDLGARDLAWLATLAGMAVNTRASIGVALYLGTMLLVAWSAWKRHGAGRREQLPTAHAGGAPATIRAVASDPSIALPIALLLLLAIAVGAVNFARWSNPFTFVDFRYLLLGSQARQLSRYPAKFTAKSTSAECGSGDCIMGRPFYTC